MVILLTLIEKDFVLIKSFLLLFLVSCGNSPFLDDPVDDVVQVQAQRQKENLFFKIEDLDIYLYFKTPILIGEEIKVLLLFTNNEGILTSPKTNLHLKLWMPNMGHGSFPTSVYRVSEGVYEITEIFFTMPGRWNLHFQLLDINEEIKEEVLWEIDL
jgi:hypothetical protein